MKIEPFYQQQNFKSKFATTDNSPENNKKNSSQATLLLSLLGLAAVGGAFILGKKKKIPIITYEDALKKSGVEVQDGIAKLTQTGKKFTGKIERYKTKNEKETVEFLDGKITEKVYHDSEGCELSGYFYKDGKLKLSVGPSSGREGKFFSFREYQDDMSTTIGDARINNDESVFEWARNFIKNDKS